MKKEPLKNQWLKKTTILLLILITFCGKVEAQELSKQQKKWIKLYSHRYIGREEQWEKLLCAISFVESANGRYKIGKLDKSYGLMQIKIGTAKDMGKMIGLTLPKTNTKIKILLINNDKINIMLASAYLGYLWKNINDLKGVIISYNSGLDGYRKMLKNAHINETYYLKVVNYLNQSKIE